MTAKNLRSAELLSQKSSRLLIVDVQERLLPAIHGHVSILKNCVKLVQAANILDIPVVATEQYPRGLGATVPELAEQIPNRPEKLRFSCTECLEWSRDTAERSQVLIAGIEAHVCVLQTTLDLLAVGFQVFVAADATGSRGGFDCDTAIRRMAAAGASIITSESALFEWCEVAGTPEFKQIAKLVRPL